MSRILIKRISVSNFKSFRQIDVPLGKFNVLIGANASGKSNFVNIFRFLKDVSTIGLDNAISMQGGVPYIVNLNNGETNDLRMQIEFEAQDFDFPLMGEPDRVIGVKLFTYSFVIEFSQARMNYKIKEEKLELSFDFKVPEKDTTGRKKTWKKIKDGKLQSHCMKKDRMESCFEPQDISVKLTDIFPLQKISEEMPELQAVPTKELKLLGVFSSLTRYYSPMGIFISGLLNSTSIFDIDPKLCKKATPITGKTHLESDGSNLA